MNPESNRSNFIILQQLIRAVVDSAAEALDIRFRHTSTKLEDLGHGLNLVDMTGNQILFSWADPLSTQKPMRIEISLGHTGPKFDPVIVLTGYKEDPRVFVFDEPEWKLFGEFRFATVKSLKRMKEDGA